MNVGRSFWLKGINPQLRKVLGIQAAKVVFVVVLNTTEHGRICGSFVCYRIDLLSSRSVKGSRLPYRFFLSKDQRKQLRSHVRASMQLWHLLIDCLDVPT